MAETTQALLRSLLDYDAQTGAFTWKVQRSPRIKAGALAGSTSGNGYRYITVNGQTHSEHRLAWLYVHGEFPASELDHINHNRSDNRLSNLRLVSRSENLRNKVVYKKSKTGIPGVFWRESHKRWTVNIRVSGTLKFVGYFQNLADAIAARKNAEKEYGFHQNHGVVLL